MSQLRQAVLDRLLKSCAASYDVQPINDGSSLKALCVFHQRDSGYVLVKKAELWAAEQHDYLYIWSVEHLTAPMAEEIFQRVLTDGEPRITPHAQHMCTYLTALVLYDSAEPAALEALKRRKKRKNYRLSLHGWMELRAAAVDARAGTVTTNRSGKSLGRDFSRLVEDIISKYSGEEKKQ